MTNNLNYRFQSFAQPDWELQQTLDNVSMGNEEAVYAVDVFISLTMAIGRKMGMELSYNRVLGDLMGYGSNADDNGRNAVASLNNQLLPLVGVAMSMRKSLGLGNLKD